MVKVLIITNILPISDIAKKRNENDIILKTEENLVERYPNVRFKYLYSLPYTNLFLSKLSTKWYSYFQIRKDKIYFLRNRKIYILG
ncbi:hypothetical protein, partial [Cyclobacterium sp.]|uniref:hypothetical protein n=1 Tax=Cyclobacterium sp. TaxID=1966343 RepID=UPI0025C6916F